tara:strand:- start:9983 stop:10831 length:849 start_codon:yes stop_codon:yes gene_type:complete
MIKLNQLTENKNTQPNLNEGLGDAISKIRNIAIQIANKKAGNAVKHLNLDKLSKDRPDAKAALNKVQSVLSKQTGLQEDLKSTINKFAVNVGTVSTMGAMLSAVLTAGSWAQYLEASFSKWYYSEIQKMAAPDVMNIMQDVYGAQAAEGTLLAKIGMYAFLVFFTIATIMFITSKLTKKNENTMIKLKDLMSEANDTYFKSFTDAASSARAYAMKKGYEIDESDWQSQIAMGGKYSRSRPSVGKTNSFTIGLMRNGKPQKRALHISVYGMESGNFELTNYVS